MKSAGKLMLIIMLLVISATVVAVGQAKPEYGGTLTIASSQTFVGFNPMFNVENYSSYVISQIFDSLVTVNPDNGEPAPFLADSWEISKDGSQITFHLHHGVKFHNGEPLTAKDVQFTYEWILDKKNASPVEAYVDWLQEVQVVDDYTVKFILKPEDTPFPPAVLSCTWGIVPKDTFLKMGKDAFAEHPIGSGPFIFKEWVKGDHVTLVRNDNYWLKKPYLAKVIFRPIPNLATAMLALESGEVDLTDNVVTADIPHLKTLKNVKIVSSPSLSYFWLGFNLRKSPFNDIRFRKAVYESFSMDDAVNSIFHGLTGVRTYGVIPPPLWANDEAYLKTIALPENDKDADRLFAELRKEGVIPKNFSVTVYAPPDPRRIKLATIVATALQKHGIKASVQSLEWGAYMDLTFRSKDDPVGKYGMYFMGWASSPDPYFFIWYLADSVNAKVGGFNSCGFSDPVVDYLLKKADTSLDHNLREVCYVAAQRLFMRSYAHIPAYRYIQTNGVNVRVHGYRIGLSGGFELCDPFSNTWVEPKS